MRAALAVALVHLTAAMLGGCSAAQDDANAAVSPLSEDQVLRLDQMEPGQVSTPERHGTGRAQRVATRPTDQVGEAARALNSTNDENDETDQTDPGTQALAAEGDAAEGADEQAELAAIEKIEEEAENSAEEAIASAADETAETESEAVVNATADAEQTAADAEEQAAIQAQNQLQECEDSLPGLANGTAIMEGAVGRCEADLRERNVTMHTTSLEAVSAIELRQTAMEHLKAQFAEQTTAHRMLQSARDERSASTSQCNVMTANAKTEAAANIEVHTQTTHELKSKYNQKLLAAMSAARATAKTAADEQRALVASAKAQAKEAIDSAVQSANLAINARKQELATVVKDRTTVVLQEAELNRTKIQDEMEAAVNAAREEADANKKVADATAMDTRKKLMKMQMRLDKAEREHATMKASIDTLNTQTKEYRTWADHLLVKLQQAVRSITEKNENAVNAVDQVTSTLSAIVQNTAGSADAADESSDGDTPSESEPGTEDEEVEGADSAEGGTEDAEEGVDTSI